MVVVARVVVLVLMKQCIMAFMMMTVMMTMVMAMPVDIVTMIAMPMVCSNNGDDGAELTEQNIIIMTMLTRSVMVRWHHRS